MNGETNETQDRQTENIVDNRNAVMAKD